MRTTFLIYLTTVFFAYGSGQNFPTPHLTQHLTQEAPRAAPQQPPQLHSQQPPQLHPQQHFQQPLMQPPQQPPLVFQTPVSQPSSEEPSPVLNPFRADPSPELLEPLKEDVHSPHSARVLASSKPGESPPVPPAPFHTDSATIGAEAAHLGAPSKTVPDTVVAPLGASAPGSSNLAAPLFKPADLNAPVAGPADLSSPPAEKADLAAPSAGPADLAAPPAGPASLIDSQSGPASLAASSASASEPVASAVKTEPLPSLLSNHNTATFDQSGSFSDQQTRHQDSNLDVLSDPMHAPAVGHDAVTHNSHAQHDYSGSPMDKVDTEARPGATGSNLQKWLDFKSDKDLMNENLYNEVQSSIHQMEQMRQSGAQMNPRNAQVQGNIVQRKEASSPVIEENSVLDNLSASRVQEAALDDKLGMELLGIVEQIQDMQKEVADALKD